MFKLIPKLSFSLRLLLFAKEDISSGQLMSLLRTGGTKSDIIWNSLNPAGAKDLLNNIRTEEQQCTKPKLDLHLIKQD